MEAPARKSSLPLTFPLTDMLQVQLQVSVQHKRRRFVRRCRRFVIVWYFDLDGWAGRRLLAVLQLLQLTVDVMTIFIFRSCGRAQVAHCWKCAMPTCSYRWFPHGRTGVLIRMPRLCRTMSCLHCTQAESPPGYLFQKVTRIMLSRLLNDNFMPRLDRILLVSEYLPRSPLETLCVWVINSVCDLTVHVMPRPTIKKIVSNYLQLVDPVLCLQHRRRKLWGGECYRLVKQLACFVCAMRAVHVHILVTSLAHPCRSPGFSHQVSFVANCY